MTVGDDAAGRDDDAARREAVLTMEPETVVWELARQLVRGHTDLVTFRRSAAAARRALPHAPAEVEKYLADFAAFRKGLVHRDVADVDGQLPTRSRGV